MRNPIARAIAGASLTLFVAAAGAAEVDPAQYADLTRSATAQDYVQVLINLNTSVPLSRVKSEGAQFRAVLEAEASGLRAELGPGAFEGGYWNNGLGQIGLYVTKSGLEALKASVNAKSFTADPTRSMRDTVYGADGSLNEPPRILRRLLHLRR